MDKKQYITEELIPQLKNAREDAAKTSAGMKAALEQFMASNDFYRTCKDKHDEAKSAIEKLEEEVRALALEAYEVDGEKKVTPHVEIKVFKTFKIVDTKKVFDWAWKNLPAAFRLDEAKIKKYALDFGDVDGTEKGEEARAQIATSL